jgi:DNA-binding PadR family transcriptional regulator
MGMYKQVMLLGLLLEKPMYGQQIREVIETHHDLLANFIKKPTIYYQLDRLAADGYLEIRRETVEAPGPGAAHDAMALRERDIYYITDRGRRYFSSLLRDMLSVYRPGLSDIDVCFFFLHHLSKQEAIALLSERHALVASYRTSTAQKYASTQDEAHRLVYDHGLTLLDAELNWLQRTVDHLRANRSSQTTT